MLGLVAALIGVATLLAGGFSRLGLGRQMVLAVLFLVVVKMAEGALGSVVQAQARAWPLIYVPVALGLGIAWALLWYAARPKGRVRRRARAEAAA
jgi:lipopolysaccharide export system permease protein